MDRHRVQTHIGAGDAPVIMQGAGAVVPSRWLARNANASGNTSAVVTAPYRMLAATARLARR
jgi:hypothetical protein